MDERQLFIWQQREMDGTVPKIGTLRDYAAAWEATHYGADYEVSNTVLTWDERDPVTHAVRHREDPPSGDMIPHVFEIPGYTLRATVMIDGRA